MVRAQLGELPTHSISYLRGFAAHSGIWFQAENKILEAAGRFLFAFLLLIRFRSLYSVELSLSKSL